MKDSREDGMGEGGEERKRERAADFGGRKERDREPVVVDGRYQGLAMINDRVQYCFH